MSSNCAQQEEALAHHQETVRRLREELTRVKAELAIYKTGRDLPFGPVMQRKSRG